MQAIEITQETVELFNILKFDGGGEIEKNLISEG